MPRLPKERILRGYKTFAGVITHGKVIASGSVKLFYTPADHSQPHRVGFSVSRSIRSATVRNRIRRCMREAYRLNQEMLQTGPATSLVLMYTGAAVRTTGRVDSRQITEDVIRGFRLLIERTRKQ